MFSADFFSDLSKADGLLPIKEKLFRFRPRFRAAEAFFSLRLRSRCVRGGMLVMSMLMIAIMFTVCMSYLLLLHTDRRFYGVLERDMQAWYLAESGESFMRFYASCESLDNLLGAAGNTLKTPEKGRDGSRVWARVYVPEHGSGYFEILKNRKGQVEIKGVLPKTLSSVKGDSCIVRSLVADNNKGWDYGIYQDDFMQ